ncbi:MAG: hypothetical protein J7501_12015 [Bdellovibrio sp.]|nr:hypothetical protein [Bdellovibrio sp.]
MKLIKKSLVTSTLAAILVIAAGAPAFAFDYFGSSKHRCSEEELQNTVVKYDALNEKLHVLQSELNECKQWAECEAKVYEKYGADEMTTDETNREMVKLAVTMIEKVCE